MCTSPRSRASVARVRPQPGQGTPNVPAHFIRKQTVAGGERYITIDDTQGEDTFLSLTAD